MSVQDLLKYANQPVWLDSDVWTYWLVSQARTEIFCCERVDVSWNAKD